MFAEELEEGEEETRRDKLNMKRFTQICFHVIYIRHTIDMLYYVFFFCFIVTGGQPQEDAGKWFFSFIFRIELFYTSEVNSSFGCFLRKIPS